MSIDVQGTIAGLEDALEIFRHYGRQATEDVAKEVQRFSKLVTPVGRPGNTTNPPGMLRESIIIDGPTAITDNMWRAQVGPTARSVWDGHTPYGRLRELGGILFPTRSPVMVWHKDSQVFFGKRVEQIGAHYMERGRQLALLAAYLTVLKDMVQAVEVINHG